MKLKLVYRRPSGEEVDVAVTTDATATIGDIAAAIAAADPVPTKLVGESLTLAAAGAGEDQPTILTPDRAVGESRIASGFTVSLSKHSVSAHGAGAAAATMRVVDGPGKGREYPLRAGASIIGREGHADVGLEDRYVSKKHARVEVGDTIELVDLNSANGIVVDGGTVQRVTVAAGQPITLGDSVLEFRRVGLTTAPSAAGQGIHHGAVAFNRSPRVEARFPGEEFARPEIPKGAEKQPFPWLPMMMPLLIGGAMFAATRRGTSGSNMGLIFMAMSPLMMLGNWFMHRMQEKRRLANEVKRFREQLARLRGQLEAGVPEERAVRLAEAPSTEEVRAAVLDQGELLWTRRPEHWNFLHLRLGLGTEEARNTVAPEQGRAEGLVEYVEELEDVVNEFRLIEDVPVAESFALAGSFGVAGTPDIAWDVVRGLVAQVVALHSPAEVVLAAITGPQSSAEVAWLKWLPHTASAHSPLAGSHLADSAATAAALVAGLEELIEVRTSDASRDAGSRGPLPVDGTAVWAGAKVGEDGQQAAVPAVPSVVVLVADGAPVDRARLVQLAERGPAVGIHLLWWADGRRGLPAACRTFIEVNQVGAVVNLVRHGRVSREVAVEGLSRAKAEEMGRRIASLIDSGALVDDDSDLPRTISLLTLLGPDMAEAATAVVDRWEQNSSIGSRISGRRDRAGSLHALVGQAGADALRLDLRSQGPHALVGGTTGSGKSEFLQSWVLGMAAENSPERVTFLFVDYKGGAAFAECTKLPHCVGLVTDLSRHLVHRALTSLRAEIHHREKLFNRKKVKDILEFEKTGDPDCPPALVIVIDEFAALAGEVPEFVDGVVDVAQRGRSLGVHLIMATQRPAGVIKDNLRANTNLRIALRMSDESDSTDVIGDPSAAAFSPSLPGRAVAKTGPGRLVPFQSAYAGGWSSAAPAKPLTLVDELRFGADLRWEMPRVEEKAPADPGPTDLARLVATISAASVAAGIGAPRKPWLSELSRAYDLKLLGPRTDEAIVFGVADLPEEQRQEPVYFLPDSDGNLAVFGTGGSGKTVLLRTLAAAAGVTPRGGPVEVYGLDFGAGGLRTLEVMPHVGSVIAGDDSERVLRLMRRLRDLADERALAWPEVSAGTLTEYRRLAAKPDEPRVLVLIDGFPQFREDYEGVLGREEAYTIFQQLLSEGRALGIHFVFTADRPASVPGAISSSVPRRVVLRMSDEQQYGLLDVPSDILSSASAPGRAIVGETEVQVAILGGSGNVADQSESLAKLAASIGRQGRPLAPPVRWLDAEIPLSALPTSANGLPVLGVAGDDLAPCTFEPAGAFVVAGGPGSGRTTALLGLVESLDRWSSGTEFWYLGSRRSLVGRHEAFLGAAGDPDEVAQLAGELATRVAEVEDRRIVVVIEGIADFTSGPADFPLQDLVKAVRRSGHLVIAESETREWVGYSALLDEMKAGRRGVVLQPDGEDGDLLKTPFGRVKRTEFPVGRGFYAVSGRARIVQLPMVQTGDRSPSSAGPVRS